MRGQIFANVVDWCSRRTIFRKDENELGFHLGGRDRRAAANATGGMGTRTDCRSAFRLASINIVYILCNM